MLTCKQVSEIAGDYLDQDLSLWQRISFRLHLAMCGHCRRFVRQMDTVVATLKGFSSKLPLSQQKANDIATQITQQLEQDAH